ncbi:DNA topoisomerase IB [Flavitalea sp. BT771]|uniref:DNA topoisomerase IB n=1 Tax=Flavitalea sp. BT771 TaxID=3063329 RepID=UPI0026E46FDC|nr:DNA topoisomerase IB [Flavitalea sp. BT771]MDO6430519.1 DNA topoisomerase IB [Flavitalea sp. BT771]MDV6219341.1 DNA topoisomerase IB [Flavitalea sp. BT771]
METLLALTHKEFLSVDRDHEKAAAAAHLVYVTDLQPGIVRLKKGKGFTYLFGDKPVKDKHQIERIRKLVIPPAWTQVWICASEKGHIQATGLDLRGRKQYRYHALWNSLRNETKFHRLYEFGKALPLLRTRLEVDLQSRELTQEKVLATVVSLMERTFIRIGNNEYEKTNGSYGLTTLKNKHVAISGDKLVFSFTGKKGIHHDVSLRNKRLARIVSQCHDIPGKELFQYYDPDGNRHPIDSGMVNGYIRDAAQQDFTAKDFRTWAGSLEALQAFRSIGEALTAADLKKNINAVLDSVSGKLGNTRTVCRKYYVHPGLIRLYEENKLVKYLHELDKMENAPVPGADAGLAAEEKILMKILKEYISASPVMGS